MRRVIVFIAAAAILLAPLTVQAVDWIPLVPCGGTGQDSCTPCHLFATVKNLIDLVLYGITGPIAAFMIVIAGGMMLLGGGKPALYSEGKELLKKTLIGVTIILLSWVATNFLIKALIRGGQGDSWNTFSCPVGLSTIPPIETALPVGGPPPALPAATLITPKNYGVAAVGGIGQSGSGGGSTFSSCNSGRACDGRCPQFASQLSGKANEKILGAIMFNESSCLVKPRQSGAGAYGLMQLLPETANTFRDACQVTQTVKNPDGTTATVTPTITAAWLQSEQNVDKIICIADKFVDSLKSRCGSNPLNLAAGYNGGPGACQISRDCPDLPSCAGGEMRRWECPWDNRSHTLANRGYIETRNYAPKVEACAK